MISSQKHVSVDGEDLISVIFERESPDSLAPVEVVFQVVEGAPSSPYGEPPRALSFLSATWTDTRLPVQLTKQEMIMAVERASSKMET